jgi:hypothetical protein
MISLRTPRKETDQLESTGNSKMSGVEKQELETIS